MKRFLQNLWHRFLGKDASGATVSSRTGWSIELGPIGAGFLEDVKRRPKEEREKILADAKDADRVMVLRRGTTGLVVFLTLRSPDKGVLFSRN